MNMLRQIAKETAAEGGIDAGRFTVYSRALKQLKETLDLKLADSEDKDNTVTVIFGESDEDYSV